MVVTKCDILLSNTNSVYGAGDSVEGVVKYVIDEPTAFTCVTLSLKAKGLCFWEPITPKTEYADTEDYIDQRMDLLQVNEKETAAIPAGTYEKQFCFVLPEEIPSSYKDFRCFFSFFLLLEFVELGSISAPKKFYANIQVQTGVKRRRQKKDIVYEAKKEFTWSKKTVTLVAFIKKPVFFVGEDITIIWETYNYAKVPIVATKIELIELVTFKSYGNNVKHKSKTLKGVEIKYLGLNRLEIEQKHIHNCSTLPYTFSINSNMLKKEYRVKISLVFPSPYKQLCLEIPVVIEEKIDDFEEDKLDDQATCWQAMYEKELMAVDA